MADGWSIITNENLKGKHSSRYKTLHMNRQTSVSKNCSSSSVSTVNGHGLGDRGSISHGGRRVFLWPLCLHRKPFYLITQSIFMS